MTVYDVEPGGPVSEIINAQSDISVVMCFAKTHRPEEQAKLAAARAKLAKLREAHPEAWRIVAEFNQGRAHINYVVRNQESATSRQ